MTKRREDQIIQDIKRYFGFLFDKGCKFRDVRYFPESFGNWYVPLESAGYFLRIEKDRGYISILFDPEKVNGRYQIGLETLIYYLSKGMHFVGYFEGNTFWGKNKQMERLADLLSKYHDQVANLFETDPQRLREDLLLAEKKYSELLQESYSNKFAAKSRVWKGSKVITLLFKFISISLLAFLGWGVGVVFLTTADIGMKVMYDFLTIAIFIFMAIFTNRLLKDLQK